MATKHKTKATEHENKQKQKYYEIENMASLVGAQFLRRTTVRGVWRKQNPHTPREGNTHSLLVATRSMYSVRTARCQITCRQGVCALAAAFLAKKKEHEERREKAKTKMRNRRRRHELYSNSE